MYALQQYQNDPDDPKIEMAFNDYLHLGPDRSVMMLYRLYQEKCEQDLFAMVPSTDRHVLEEWERLYNWRSLAWQYDAVEQQNFRKQRLSRLAAVYEGDIKVSEKVMQIAEKALERIDKSPDIQLSPGQALSYLQAAVALRQQATQKRIELDDPRSGNTQEMDFMDSLRVFALNNLNINVQNNYGTPPTLPR